MSDLHRGRFAPALLAVAALVTTGAVAVPAAGAAVAGRRVVPAAGATTPATPATTRATTGTTTASTSTARPHCTGCVEHQVFGFEDGSDQNWRPYGVTTTSLAGTRWTSTASPTAGAPHSGGLMLAIAHLGHGGGLRWPATTDATLSGFQVRVWVRARSRSATLRLTVGDHSGATTATALVTPGVWTPITTSRWMGDRSTVEVRLTQDDPCRDGDIDAVDLDDTAIASSFDTDPAIWRSDDTSLLAPALPQITVTTTPCPSTSTSPSQPDTLLTFEDGTTQGWEGVGGAKADVSTVKPLAGAASLRVRGLGKDGAAARLTTATSAWGGSGAWYRLVFVATGSQPQTATTVYGTCAPVKTRRVSAKLKITVAGATQVIGSRASVDPKGSSVEVWFQLPSSSRTVTVDVAAVNRKVSAVFVDTVVLSHGTPPAGASAAASAAALDEGGSGGAVQPLCVRTSGKTTY